MRLAVLLLLALAAAAGTLPARADPRRDVLWLALQTCTAAKRLMGAAFPCLAVDLGDAERPGTAVLRAPGARTHVVVMPIDKVVGLEASELQGERGVAYWRAALAARRFVGDALPGGEPVEEVGLAINSVGGRSQDHLHIHLDCVKPSVRAALERHARGIGPNWRPLPFALPGGRYFALHVGSAEVERFNPFAALSRLPERREDLRDASFAAVSAPRGETRGGVVLLARRGPTAGAEALLDHKCEQGGREAVARR